MLINFGGDIDSIFSSIQLNCILSDSHYYVFQKNMAEQL